GVPSPILRGAAAVAQGARQGVDRREPRRALLPHRRSSARDGRRPVRGGRCVAMSVVGRLWERRAEQMGLWVVGILVVLGFLLLLLWRSVFVIIPPGEIGVLYDLLFGGTRVWRVYQEGLRIKLPWNRMYIYDARLQSKSLTVKTLSREGMRV